MRESTFSFAHSNKACICISSALYDRRAIDSPAPSLPLVNSLTHLSYLTATSPRIREILSVDGGLERLVKILKRCASSKPEPQAPTLADLKGKGKDLTVPRGPRKSPFKPFNQLVSEQDLPASATTTPSSSKSKHLLYTYTLAFQCVVNVGVRGSESIRTRVVQAGALEIVINVLERYLDEVERKRKRAMQLHEAELRSEQQQQSRHVRQGSADFDVTALPPPARVSTPDTVISNDDSASTMLVDETGSASGHDGEQTEADEESAATACPIAKRASNLTMSAVTNKSSNGEPVERSEPQDQDVDMNDRPADEHSAEDEASNDSADASKGGNGLEFRDEDILLSLQLLAYLSKYPHVRNVFHDPRIVPSSQADRLDNKSTNLFSLVEKFTHRPSKSDRITPRHSNEVQYWAGVIMRNACRKDDSQNGIRQCANMECGVWERYPREFAKCRRCRKAKYCSKQCQSKAWQLGHRYWCAKAQRKEPTATTPQDTPVPDAAAATVASHATGDVDMADGHHHHHHHHQHHRQHQTHRHTQALDAVVRGDQGGRDVEDDDDEDDLPITRSPTQDSLLVHSDNAVVTVPGAPAVGTTVDRSQHGPRPGLAAHPHRMHRISNPTLPAGLTVFEGQFEDHGDNVRVAMHASAGQAAGPSREVLWRRSTAGRAVDEDETDERDPVDD